MLQPERDECSQSVRAIALHECLVRWARRLTCLTLVAAIGLGGYLGFGAWTEHHLATQARACFERGDDRQALLVTQRLLEHDERNIAATRLRAEIEERGGRAEAVTWRKRLVVLQPGVVANHFALVSAALRFGQIHLAENVLEGLPQEQRATVTFHQLAAALALATKDSAGAEWHFRAAHRLDPNDQRAVLNLAIIALQSSTQVALVARADLQRVALQSPLQSPLQKEALRALAADAIAHHDLTTASDYTRQLIAHQDATLTDHLLYLEAQPGVEAKALEQTKTVAASSPAQAAELITWMNRHGLAQEALAWSATLPPAFAATPPVPLALAESYGVLENWAGLRAWVGVQQWGEFESLRLAIESHALRRLPRGKHEPTQAQSVWRDALEAAGKRADLLISLAQLAESWGDKPEAAELWWTVANGSDDSGMALAALQRQYHATQDGRGLLRVAKRALELNPNDLVAANNCASLGLLLGESSARRLAARLYDQHPENSAIAATYAFALLNEGKLPQALRMIESLHADKLRYPPIAAYHFLMLVANGELDRAKSVFPLAEKASLLPEEQQLVANAKRQLL